MANGQIQLPPEAQRILVQMQTFQQQYQAIAMQKETMTIQRIETENALEELEKAKDKDDVFKAVGPILVKSSKKALQKELGERKENLEIRLKSLEKTELKLKEKLDESQKNLQEIFKGIQTPDGEAE